MDPKVDKSLTIGCFPSFWAYFRTERAVSLIGQVESLDPNKSIIMRFQYTCIALKTDRGSWIPTYTHSTPVCNETFVTTGLLICGCLLQGWVLLWRFQGFCFTRVNDVGGSIRHSFHTQDLVTVPSIFTILSSFLRMLCLTAAMRSCWSWLADSSSCRCDFSGSIELSVILEGTGTLRSMNKAL